MACYTTPNTSHSLNIGLNLNYDYESIFSQQRIMLSKNERQLLRTGMLNITLYQFSLSQIKLHNVSFLKIIGYNKDVDVWVDSHSFWSQLSFFSSKPEEAF